jgi:hypothetical protein
MVSLHSGGKKLLGRLPKRKREKEGGRVVMSRESLWGDSLLPSTLYSLVIPYNKIVFKKAYFSANHGASINQGSVYLYIYMYSLPILHSIHTSPINKRRRQEAAFTLFTRSFVFLQMYNSLLGIELLFSPQHFLT